MIALQIHSYSTALLILIVGSGILSNGQNTNGCSQYFRNVHRTGLNLHGRLEIPTDELYPKYKLRIGFSSPIHHVTVRQSRAKDTGTHREFLIDPMEAQKDGKLHMDILIRLHRFFGPLPRMTRLAYNNDILCGDALDPSEIDESLIVTLPTSAPQKSTRRVPILTVTNNFQPSKNNEDAEEEEDIF